MPRYRNVSGAALYVDTGGGWREVADGDVIDITATDRYVQTGETGETPLFELLIDSKTEALTKGDIK